MGGWADLPTPPSFLSSPSGPKDKAAPARVLSRLQYFVPATSPPPPPHLYDSAGGSMSEVKRRSLEVIETQGKGNSPVKMTAKAKMNGNQKGEEAIGIKRTNTG